MDSPMDPRTMQEMVQRILKLRPQLDAATDLLNKNLSEFEKTLISLRLNVSAGIGLEPDDEDPKAFRSRLEFGKFEGDWRITVTRDDQVMLLTRAPRSVRMLAASRLPQLFEGLVKAMNNELSAVKQKTEDLTKLTQQVHDLRTEEELP